MSCAAARSIPPILMTLTLAILLPLKAEPKKKWWKKDNEQTEEELEKSLPGGSVSPENNAGSQGETTPAEPMVVNPATRARVQNLIAAIEQQASGLIINRSGRVNNPRGDQPYNPDGSRNQNFRVVPDYQSGPAAVAGDANQRRKRATMELIKIGPAAVPQLSRALVNDFYKQRHLYAFALGEIKDLRAVPALIKYFEEALMKKKTAKAFQQHGDPAMANKLTNEAEQMIEVAWAALKKISGKDYGPDITKYKAWWEANKHTAGPCPSLDIYKAVRQPQKGQQPSQQGHDKGGQANEAGASGPE